MDTSNGRATCPARAMDTVATRKDVTVMGPTVASMMVEAGKAVETVVVN